MLVAAWCDWQCSGWSTASMAGPMHGCLSGWLAGCLAGWLAGWLHGCMAAWLHGCMAAWLLGCMAAWLHGCTAAWLHGWLSGCLLSITPFPGSLCWVLRNTSMPVRVPHPPPPLHKIRQSLPLCHASAQHTAHSTQHTAHSTAQWFLGGKCLVLINTVFNASPTPSP